MASIPRHDRAWLLKAAKELALHLRPQVSGTSLKILQPAKIIATTTETAGWSAIIGNLGKGRPSVEIWLDRFSGHPDRKLYVCFYSREKEQIQTLSRMVAKKLWPVRTITDEHLDEGAYYRLSRRLALQDFNAPIIEHYDERRYHFFGFYDQTRQGSVEVSPAFIEKATGFLLDVACSQPDTKDLANLSEAYPRCENRKWVNAHLRRERSSLLAAQCKSRDKYRCKVCDMSFVEVYGDPVGTDFAEAHHILALGKLPDTTLTRIEDLITVCANCHRMLHRMDGKPDDIKKLRASYLKHRKARP